MPKEARYCTSADGTQIAYSVEGSGPPLLLGPYFFESFAADHTAIGGWEELINGICEGRRVVRYCVRGSSLSQRQITDPSIDRNVEDIEAVVLAAGLDSFDIMGWVMSSGATLQFAATHPEAVRRAVIYAGFAAPTDVMPDDALNALELLCRTNWTMASQTLNDMSLRSQAVDDALRQVGNLRDNIAGDTIAQFFALRYDLSPLLQSISAPVMLLHRTGDTSIPFSTSQRLASLIPSARLVPLNGEINYAGVGDVQEIIDAIVSFLDEGAAPATAPRPMVAGGFRTILFTDVVGHTSIMQRLGDEEGRKLLREHERMTREALGAHGGSEVKAMGDGFMVSFDSATRAVQCAIDLQQEFEREAEISKDPVRVRVGINAGEPIAEDDDLFGTAVILAARIAAQAGAGEILVSEAVRQIVAGKGFLFSDHGETALRGFEDSMHVYEVNWRG